MFALKSWLSLLQIHELLKLLKKPMLTNECQTFTAAEKQLCLRF